VGALDGATIAACPSLDGARLLERLWLSEPAGEVFHVNPLRAILTHLAGGLGPLSPAPVQKLIEGVQAITGCQTFESLRVPLLVVATDFDSGHRAVLRDGPLTPALLASAAIPGLFPPVRIDGRDYLDGGIVDNVPISVALCEGYRDILAIGLMGGAELPETPSNWSGIIARTLQLGLHHRLLSDFECYRRRGNITVICPVTPPEAAWDMRRSHVESLLERSRRATAALIASNGRELFKHSAIHYLDLDRE
jgi:NTE family protein